MKPDPKSEEALKSAIKRWPNCIVAKFQGGRIHVIGRTRGAGIYDELVAVIDLKEIIRKRQPLTGITKRLKSAVRSPKKSR